MENSTKHRWYDVIVAWANGETIQHRLSEKSTWQDFPYDSSQAPNFDSFLSQWRIKPKVVIKKYRMALVLQEDNTQTVQAFDVTNSGFPVPFIRWIGDTVEVEFSCD